MRNLKNKRKKKKTNRSQIKIQWEKFLGGSLILFSILFFVGLISSDMGVIGEIIHSVFYFLFGRASTLFSIFLFCFGIFYLSNKSYEKKWKWQILLLVYFSISLIAFELSASNNFIWKERISDFESFKQGGGFFGFLISLGLINLFGKIGTIIIISILGICGIFWILNNKQKEKILTFIKDSSFNIIRFFQKKVFTQKKPTKKFPRAEKVDKEVESFPLETMEAKVNDFTKQGPVNDEGEKEKKIHKAQPLKKEEILHFQEDLKLGENTLDQYNFPPIGLLKEIPLSNTNFNSMVKEKARIIEETMENFNIDSKVRAINHGPSVTCYELEPAPGVRLNRIVALADNLAFSLASSDIRIEAPIPGKSAVGIEVPNKIKESVGLKDIIESSEFIHLNSKVPLALGKDVSGKNIISSIDKMPHLLIAGATGSGKSVCINTILISILFKSKPSEVKLILIDPKVVELGVYNEIPHLLIPVVTDAKKAAFALSWAVDEMEKRYKKFAEQGVRDIKGYNSKIDQGQLEDLPMPQIIIVVDELSDLMMVAAKEVEDYITRLAQMARAAGIHLILATQRPSVDVITGTIKANIPSRIAFSVSSQIDSRTILDMAGAEKLLGKGDMLFYPSSYPKPKRIQGAFVSDEEVEAVLRFIKENAQEQEYHEEAIEAMESKISSELSDQDPLLDEAIEIAIIQDQASISFIQRKLKVGYSRAARIIDQMEEIGIIGPHEGSKPRKLLLSEEESKKYLEDKENV